MASEGSDATLLRIAEAISDGTPVDWALEKQARPDLVDSLEVFEKVAVITGVASETPEVPPAPTASSHTTTMTWGNLHILETIGEGNFGDVYRAYDPALQTEVALKLRKKSPTAGMTDEEFLGEARRLARVRHTNVVQVYGADSHDGRVGMWTELVHGETLEQLLEKQGPLGADEASVIGSCLCRALAAVHGTGIVHRDVKTHNVMREKGGRIVLMDFGSGGKLPPKGELHLTANTRWTPLAMSPELMRGEAGSAADIYALGVLLYRLVSGRYPVEAETFPELADKLATGQSIPIRDRRPDLPADFVAVVEKALESDPARRYSSAGEMERALAATVGHGVVQPTTSTIPEVKPVVRQSESEATDKQIRRRTILRALPAAAAVVIIAVGLWSAFHPHGWLRDQGSGGEGAADRTPVHDAGELLVQPPPSVVDRAADHSAAPPASASPPGLAAVPQDLTVKVNLFRVTASGHERLRPGGRVQPGDALFLEIEGTEALHVYVLNEDEAGEVNVLFPAPSFEQGNPLAPDITHRLPGTRGGLAAYWQVTSPGRREYVMVVASRQPQPQLELELAHLRPAEPGRPVTYRTVSDSVVVALIRGIGGVVSWGPNAPASRPTRLSEVIAQVDGVVRVAHDPWVWEIHLENPGP